MSAVLLAGNVADANATLPKDDPKEAVQAPTDDHLPLLMINGTNKSVSFIVSSEALPGKDIKNHCSAWIYGITSYDTGQYRKT